MQGKVFHSLTSKHGFLGIKCNFNPSVTIIGYKSPFASVKQNEWLEKVLIKVYSIYYYRVLLATHGRFWENVKPVITEKAEDFIGGMTNDIQLKEFISR